MTRIAVTSRASYVADGLATLRNIGFPLDSAADLIVTVAGVVQALNTHYSITGALTNPVMTPLSPFWTNGTIIRYRRNTSARQDYDAQAGVALFADGIEATLDRNVMAVQDAQSEVDAIDQRALAVEEGAVAPVVDLTGLLENDILQYRGGKLQRLARESFAGKFYGGAADGSLVPLSGTGADAGLRSDLAVIGGELLAMNMAADLPLHALLTVFREGPAVSAHYFRKPSDPDDTLAWERALAVGLPVHVQGGKGSGAGGVWVLKQQDLTGATSLIKRSGVRIFGDGKDRTIVEGTSDTSWLLHAAKNTADPANNYRGIRISDMQFRGRVATDGFAEFTHLISLSAVSDVNIERCSFVGFQGDGIYIGQGNIGGQEIHNERVTIRDCYFDGVTNNQRNGVSFIDCDKSLIENSTFIRCSRPGQTGWAYPLLGGGGIDFPAYYAELAANKMNPNWGPGMPGPIDYEPDGNNARIIDAIVRGCLFFGCSGNVGTIALQIPTTVPKGNVRGILWEGNTFRLNYGTGAEMHVHIVRAVADPLVAADNPNQIVMRNNKGWGGYNGRRVAAVYSAKDVLIESNSFTDYEGGFLLGYIADTRSMKTFGLAVKRNVFTRCANTGGDGIMNRVHDAEQLRFIENEYHDCGIGTVFSNVWNFGAGTSAGVEISRNIVTSATNKTANNVILKEAGHTFSPASNRQYGNEFGGRASFFEASHSDIAQAYTPIIEGGSAAGAGTYTAQYGEYTISGGLVQGYARAVITGHTGTGIIEISLPIDPADLSGPDYPAEIVIQTTGAGVPGAGKQVVAQVHGFAVADGRGGAIRVYTFDPATGLLAALNIQNVAYTIYVRFGYRAQVPA